LVTCPSCGKEVREDFGYCPFCATPLKPFCPSCKRELKPGYVACPYCGFRLEAGTPARQLYRKGGRSMFLRVLTVLTLFGGIIDVVQGANEGTFQFANYTYQGPIPDAARYLALFQFPIGILVVVIGVVEFFIVYGLTYGKAFSRRYLLKLASLTFLLSVVMLSVDAAMSTIFSLPSAIFSFDIFFVVWTFFLLAVTNRYVSQQEVREILRATAAPDRPDLSLLLPTERTGLPQSSR
jgi:hypothetical protein